MGSVEKLKKKYNKSQFITADLSGVIQYSEGSLFKEWISGVNIVEAHPFFEIISTLHSSSDAESEYSFPCVHLESEGVEEKICDVAISLESAQINIIIFDYTLTYQELNSISQERNESIIKSQELEFSNKLLVEKEKFKNNFITNINHELTTPLTSIKGFLELLEKTELDYEQEELVKIIKSESSFLQSIFRDMLDISRIESGEFSLKKETFDFIKLLKEIEGAYRVISESKLLKFEVQIDKKINPLVQSDKTRLYQILSGLLSNSMKYTDEGDIKLVVSKISGKSKKQELEIRVKDSGIGISSENKDLIFEPFSQLDRTTSGSGLGLHITRNLVHLMGGTITFTSEPGKGTEFVVILKLKSAKKEESLAYEKEYTLPKGKKYRVLIVENRLNTQYLIMKQLLSQGCFFVDAVSNAEDALKSIENRNYDLIITDIKLPRASGLELTKKIRNNYADTAIKNVPILGLSGVQVPNILSKSIAYGMDSFLPKPFTQEALLKKVSRLLLLKQ